MIHRRNLPDRALTQGADIEQQNLKHRARLDRSKHISLMPFSLKEYSHSLRNKDTLLGQLARGIAGIGGLKLISLLLSFVTSVVLARSLGPEGFGRYAFLITSITVLALPIERGLRPLITREIANYHHEFDWERFRGLTRWAKYRIFTISFVIWATLGSITLFYAEWTLEDRWSLFLIPLFALPILGLNTLRSAGLRGLGHVVHAQLPELFVRPAVQLATAIFLVAFGILNTAYALASYILAVFAGLLLAGWLLRRVQPLELKSSPPKYESKYWTSAWFPLTIIAAATMLNNQIGILLLGWLGNDADVGGLRVADRGAQLVSFALTAVNLALAPYIARAYRDGNADRLQRLSRGSARLALAAALPIALPLIFFGDPIISLVFGEDYNSIATMPLAILASAQLVNVAFGSVGMLLTMTGFEKISLTGHLFALTLNVAVALALIPSFGAEGAAIAAALGLITWNLVLALYVNRKLHLFPGFI